MSILGTENIHQEIWMLCRDPELSSDFANRFKEASRLLFEQQIEFSTIRSSVDMEISDVQKKLIPEFQSDFVSMSDQKFAPIDLAAVLMMVGIEKIENHSLETDHEDEYFIHDVKKESLIYAQVALSQCISDCLANWSGNVSEDSSFTRIVHLALHRHFCDTENDRNCEGYEIVLLAKLLNDVWHKRLGFDLQDPTKHVLALSKYFANSKIMSTLIRTSFRNTTSPDFFDKILDNIAVLSNRT